jgi:hypothetical protein
LSPAQLGPLGVPAAHSWGIPPRPPKAGAPWATKTQEPAGTVTIVIMDGKPGKARTSWICAGVKPRIALGSDMNGRFGAVTGEHEGSGQKTRTNWVGVAVTTIAAGAVGTKDGVAVQEEGKMYAFASAPLAIEGTKGGGQEKGALKPVRLGQFLVAMAGLVTKHFPSCPSQK